MQFPFDMSSAEWLLNEPEKGAFCVIFRNVIPSDVCEYLYNESRLNCVRQYPITFMGRETLQPRLTCAYSDPHITEHRYSGQAVPTIPWPYVTEQLRNRVALPHFRANSALINGYLDPDHNVGWHSDKNLMDPLKTVITVSICGSRRFSFREKANHSNTVSTKLNNGDVVYFYGTTNDLYDHTILKCLKKDVDQRPRYSITFRIL